MSDDERRLTDYYDASYPPSVYGGAPSLVSLVPSTGVVGQSITVTVNGAGFEPSSVVRADGAALPTVYVSATVLTVSGTPLTSGSAVVTVANGAKVSNGLIFTVTTVAGLAVEKRGRGRARVHWQEHAKQPAPEPTEPEPDDEADADELVHEDADA
jgi:hypothetical protein